MIAQQEKRCPRCGETKPAEGFYKDKKSKSGLSCYCRACKTAESKRYAELHPEWKRENDRKQSSSPRALAYYRERDRKRRQENPEKERARVKRWEANNPEKVKARRARWNDENRETVRASQARYHASDRYKAIHADRERLRRSAKKCPEGIKPSLIDWDAICEKFGRHCVYCGSEDRITIEHLTPLSRGGTNDVDNIAPACWACNVSKNNKTLEEYAPDRAPLIRCMAEA